MVEVYNPNFPQLGAEVALASGLLLPELFRKDFGAREAALEAPEIFLVASEMAPATELAKIPKKILERKLVRIPEMEPVTAPGTAQSNQWVLSSQPLAFFAVADLLIW